MEISKEEFAELETQVLVLIKEEHTLLRQNILKVFATFEGKIKAERRES